MSTTDLMGISICQQPLSDIIREAVCFTEEARAEANPSSATRVFSCANPHSLVVADTDAEFHDALAESDWVVADGIGILLFARLSRLPIDQHITGTDFFLAAMNALPEGSRVFFLGSTPEVLRLIRSEFEKQYPHLVWAGAISPPFGDWDAEVDAEMTSAVNRSQADVLWVGMTAPKQEKWVHAQKDALDVALIGSIGAVFDFFAGTKPRAPDWMLRMGLEWAHRLLREPRRMWRRNFISTPVFMAKAARWQFFEQSSLRRVRSQH